MADLDPLAQTLTQIINRQVAEIERLRDVLQIIAQSGEDSTADQLAPDQWAWCRELAQLALSNEIWERSDG